MNPVRVVSKIVNNARNFSNKLSLNDIIIITDTYRKMMKDF